MGDNFKIILEAMIDQSSLTNAQKQVAKERLKIGADISVEDFAKSKQAIEKQMVDLAKGIKTILGDAVSDKQATQWANQYYKQMVDGAKQAEKQLAKEAAQRQKNIELAQKQEAANRKAALDYTRDASRKLSGAVSKYSYGDSKEANKMIKQMNRGVSNFGDLEDIEGDAKRLDAIIDGIIANLQRSHAETLKSINAEIKAEQEKAKIVSDFNKQQDKAIPNGVDDLIKKREQEAKHFSSVLKESMNIRQAVDLGDYDVQFKTIESTFKNLGLEAGKVEGHVKEVKTALDNLKSPKEGQNLIDLDADFNTALEKAKNNAKMLKMDMENIYNPAKQAKLSNDILNWLTKNTAASKEARQTLQQYYDQLQGGKVNVATLDKIQAELKEIDAQQRGLGKLGKNLKDQFKQAGESFTQWLSVSSAVMFGIQKTREAIGELKELDSILTEISKTSDLTASQLERLGDSAFDTASKYGKKASDYLTGVQEMYRAGFDNAEQMAELSVLAQSAGDMESNAANDYLMATNAAYDYKGSVEELNKVLDSQNYITNNAAISMQDIADATTQAASIASQYGVEMDELSALISVAVSKTRESGSEVGTALKALFINLQDTTSKPVQEAFAAVDISMTKMVDGSERLKTPIELIKELSVAFNELPEGDVKRANILNDIGGKHHANTLAAILSDLDAYNEMLALYNSSSADGSAFREAEKSANNLEGSLNKLSNTWTDTVNNIADSDALKFGVNSLEWVLDKVNWITEKLGSLGSIGLGVGLWKGIKNTGICV